MLERWGLQKRIMAYVAVGLFVGFAAFFFVGMRAVGRSTQFVLDERLAIAGNVAAKLSREIDHVIPDTEEQFLGFSPDADRASLEDAVDRALGHFATVDRFAFFDVSSLWLVDTAGGLLAGAPEGSYRAEDSLAPPSAAPLTAPRIAWPEDSDGNLLFSAIVPLRGPTGEIWAYAVVNTKGRDVRSPFIPAGLREARDDDEDVSPASQYHLEVLTRSGMVVLGIGPDENVGEQSPHYSVIKDWMSPTTDDATLHTAPDVNEGRTHIMAAVPVASAPLYMVLEQDREVALAVATDFRTQLMLFSVFGFLGALVVAWVTTRRVVRPTELLTAAAERMASGELSTPIEVTAQDEIGVLARSLELMRQRLEQALSEVEAANKELEARVRERTRQLQELVRRVFTAQEEERHRVALELHDETAQALTAVKMALDAIAIRGADRLTPEDAETLRDAQRMSRTTLETVRRLIQSLGPAALEHMGVSSALRSYADEFLKPLSVDVRGPQARLPDQVELALYRIGQEALNNVIRHSGASSAHVSLSHDDSSVVLVVTDDGVGFDPGTIDASPSPSRGVGIAGMRERAHVVGGELLIESAIGRGTTVRVEVPVPTDE